MVPYHVMSDIVADIDQRLMDTRDADYLAREAMDHLVTICRIWINSGTFNAKGAFHLAPSPDPEDTQTPSEYAQMAAVAMDTTLNWLDWLCLVDRDAWEEVSSRLHLSTGEMACWLIVADTLRA